MNSKSLKYSGLVFSLRNFEVETGLTAANALRFIKSGKLKAYFDKVDGVLHISLEQLSRAKSLALGPDYHL